VATVFRECNKFASVYTLVALSVDRFLATFHQFGRFRQIRNGLVACVTIWLICVALSTPYWLYSDIEHTSRNQFSCKVSFNWYNIPYEYKRPLLLSLIQSNLYD